VAQASCASAFNLCSKQDDQFAAADCRHCMLLCMLLFHLGCWQQRLFHNKQQANSSMLC
jgi:hypothetical protein